MIEDSQRDSKCDHLGTVSGCELQRHTCKGLWMTPDDNQEGNRGLSPTATRSWNSLQADSFLSLQHRTQPTDILISAL